MAIKIAIDAGHGSNTAGKRTPDGYKEHTATVKVASYFAKEMERCGVAFIKTGWNDDNSADDADTALATRQKTIKAAKCDYSISFHFNAYGDGKTYNSAEGVETIISNSAPGDSLKMATAIQNHMIKGTTQKNRGVKSQALAMCNCTAMGVKAAVLVECAFMTNEREADLMKSDAFCKECAQDAAKGFCEYAGINYVPETATPEPTPAPTPAPEAPKTDLPYVVKITADALNVRKGPGPSYAIATTVYKNQKYTIVEESNGWGKLKSGAGWISLSYTVRA